MKDTSLRSAGWLLLWGLAAGAGWASFQPPAAVPASAPAEVFSAERAMAHVRVLSAAPRAIGTAGHREARAYIVGVLRELGWEVTEDPAVVFSRRWGAQITNIEAQLPGADAGPAVLLVSHYDGVPTGPGAGDSAAGVGSILEVARLLAASPPAHPVRLLLTDGEELGLLGARHYVEGMSAGEVRTVVNLEARGGGGASMLFESHHDNSNHVEAFARSAAPVGTSLAYEVYRRMPNDTDFSVFRRAGVEGLNLAFIGRFHHYHSALDQPERLDVRSVQHHGENLWALARGLGELPAAEPGENTIYFPLPGRLLVRYPSAAALPLAVLALLGAALTAAAQRPRLRADAVLRGVGLVLAAAAVAIGVGLGAALGLGRWVTELSQIRLPLPYRPALWVAGLVALSAGAAGAVAATSERLGADLRVGAAAAWGGLALLTALLVPGGSYLFLWPALLAGMRLSGPAAAVGWLLAAPLLGLLFDALGLLAAAPVGLLMGLLVTVSLPALGGSARRWSGVLLSTFGCVLLGVAVLRSGTDVDHPRHEGQVYWLDADSGAATLYTARPDVTGTATSPHPLLRGVVAATAPDGAAAPAEVAVERLGGRRVRATIRAAQPASLLRVVFAEPERLSSLSVDGHALPVQEAVNYFADLSAGVVVEVEVSGDAPMSVTVQSMGFVLPAALVPAAADRMSTPWGMGTPDGTVVSQQVTL